MDMQTTQGPFFVRPTQTQTPVGFLTICQDKTERPLALVMPLDGNVENWGDAAMFAAAPNMLETLIEIQNMLMTSKETIDLETINEMISQICEKILAEADV